MEAFKAISTGQSRRLFRKVELTLMAPETGILSANTIIDIVFGITGFLLGVAQLLYVARLRTPLKKYYPSSTLSHTLTRISNHNTEERNPPNKEHSSPCQPVAL